MGDFLTEYAKEVSEKYESFLKGCYEKCGYDSIYISEHPNEFSMRGMFGRDSKNYYHFDVWLFTITQHRDYETIGSGVDSFFWKCVYSYEVTYNKEMLKHA